VEAGTEHVYHSMTFGFLVGEVVWWITGKSLGTFFADEVPAPLGLSAWIGLPEEEEGRVARIEYAAPFTMEEMTAGMIETTGLDQDTVIAWMNAVSGPDSVQARAGVLGGALDPEGEGDGHFQSAPLYDQPQLPQTVTSSGISAPHRMQVSGAPGAGGAGGGGGAGGSTTARSRPGSVA
jgi:CubicO group peptidase (beta-lactamase class C family)